MGSPVTRARGLGEEPGVGLLAVDAFVAIFVRQLPYGVEGPLHLRQEPIRADSEPGSADDRDSLAWQLQASGIRAGRLTFCR
jgi:hypothetical protein